MTKNEILEYFKDINHAYNDCTRYDTLKRMLDELQEPCADAISRQTAIDALTKTSGIRGDALKALYDLPPVSCTDAISREAVLKAIDEKAWEFCDYLISKGRNDEQKPVSHFADNLRECISEDLPPVTPQYTDAEIQKMQDLEFAEIQKAYEIGKAENPNKWIPVSERLPEKPDMYTVTDSKGDVVRFVFNDTESSRKYWLRCAKAWMPLPEPYKASPTGEEVQDAGCD